jgi:(p)ppGpp synthase/HD superfamily hydrolase
MKGTVKKMNIAHIAQEIAQRAHDGQFRRDGITPYAVHPERVAKRIAGDEEAEAVAWLHDVLEDTDETAETLARAGVPASVITAVQILTKTPSVAYTDYLYAVRANPLARKVKIQDMLDNLSDSPSEKQIIKYSRGFLVLLNDIP